MKRLFNACVAVLALVTLSLVSCEKPISDLVASDKGSEVVLTAELADTDPETKNMITDDTQSNMPISWLAGDAINVFFGNSESSKFTTAVSGRIAEFTGSINGVVGGVEGATQENYLWGVYPYQDNTTCNGSSVFYTLPSVQEAVAGTFADDLFPSIARSQNFYMSFYNVCGGFRFSVSSPDIVKVTLRGNKNENLAGRAKITVADGRPVVEEVLEGSTELVMTAPNGGCFETGKYYYFVAYPQTFSEGLTVTYHKSDSQADYVVSKSYALPRSKFATFNKRDTGLTFEKSPVVYIDEYGVNRGVGIEVAGIVWAPVNCGYNETSGEKLYQWGRKYGQGGANVSIVSAPVTLSVGQSESNANVFYKNSSSQDWLDTENATLWNAGTIDAPVKTTYDPCPSGWRTPTDAELSKLTQSNPVWTRDASGQYGTYFSDSANEEPKLFLPAVGSRYWHNGQPDGGWGKYWSSRDADNGFSGYLFLNDSYAFLDGAQKANGFSVRCVLDNSNSSDSGKPSSIDLSEKATANSYIVSEAGSYQFTPTKGNSNETVGAIAFAEVLWETFGTDVTPNVGDLIKDVKYENGVVIFKTPDAYKEGNAVIAAKDASGTILWSWHIWLTDQPEGQEYYNNAGTMMDRNLGATSATPGDVCALGLFYQWGRKDPFLGSSSIYNAIEFAKSTMEWPLAVKSDVNTGTIEYAISNPSTFISYNSYNYDWYFTGDESTDKLRWTESNTKKSIYDPCPDGWRVPDGGSNSVWSTASSSTYFTGQPFDNSNSGVNFSGKFGLDTIIWYPASGWLTSGLAMDKMGFYWSASVDSPSDEDAHTSYYMHFAGDIYNTATVYLAINVSHANGYSVRCQKE